MRIIPTLVVGSLAACAAISVLVTVAIVLVLGSGAAEFFQQISLHDFLFGTSWSPLIEPKSFGVLPLVSGTFLVAVGAAAIAIPVGLAIGVFLSEYASPGLRRTIKPALEMIAGIPSVVFGYFAVSVVSPAIIQWFPNAQIFNAASASIILAIMIIPLIVTLCDDALQSVPRSLHAAGHALGATQSEIVMHIAVPAALSGILAAFILALSRALGETMAVTLAAGSTPNLTFNFLESVQTMTAYIVQVSLGDTPHGSLEYQSLFAVGALLFVMTYALNILARRIVKAFRLKYD